MFLKNDLASLVRIFNGAPPFARSTSDLNVIKAPRYLCYSPITIILLIGGQNSLTQSSILTGATFSPPAVIINSFILPVMKSKPFSSIFP